MKIIYVTTAMEANDYREFCKLWSRKPNPSNQNFHNKLIRALALTNEVEVLSIRPFSKKLCSVRHLSKEFKQEKNINWNYVAIKSSKILRYIDAVRHYHKTFKKRDLRQAVILVDTINPTCLSAAAAISKRNNLPMIGICTDSPSNITGTTKSYTTYLLKKASKCNGYIALTDELNTLFNENGKPSIIIEGIVENQIDVEKTIPERPYIFFGGSLMKRYGVFELIDGFKLLDRNDIDLYIAGHSGDNSLIRKKVSTSSNIKLLGTINVKDVLKYEASAICNINPRPFSEDLDRFSIPSKTLEYLTSGQVTISVRNSKLQKYFTDEIVWVNNSTKEEFRDVLSKVVNMGEDERKAIGLRAKEKVQSLFSLDQINQKVSQFLLIFPKN